MRPDVDEGNEMSEDEIDQNVEDSFPASDPPSWTLGTDHVKTGSDDEETEKDA